MKQHKHSVRGERKALIKRVLWGTIVDTRRYRYYLLATAGRLAVLRTGIEDIGTPADPDPEVITR